MTLPIDFTSQDYLRNPAAGIERLRAAGPVVEVRFPIIGKTWITTTSDLAGRVLKDSETFTMRKNGRVAGLRWWMPGWIRTLAVSMLTWTSQTIRVCAVSSTRSFVAAPFSTWNREFSQLPMSLRPSCSLTEVRPTSSIGLDAQRSAIRELEAHYGAIGRAAEQAFGSLDAAAQAVRGPILPNGSRKNSGSSGGVRLFHVRGES